MNTVTKLALSDVSQASSVSTRQKVVVLPVFDVDCAKCFYAELG